MVNTSDMQALQEKLQEVLADEAFVKELFQMEKVEDVQAALEEKGIEVSKDELNATREALIKMQEKGVTTDELSEEELEEVTGGSIIVTVLCCIFFGGMAGGMGAAVGIRNGW